jgi:hypothetical protein
MSGRKSIAAEQPLALQSVDQPADAIEATFVAWRDVRVVADDPESAVIA